METQPWPLLLHRSRAQKGQGREGGQWVARPAGRWHLTTGPVVLTAACSIVYSREEQRGKRGEGKERRNEEGRGRQRKRAGERRRRGGEKREGREGGEEGFMGFIISFCQPHPSIPHTSGGF